MTHDFIIYGNGLSSKLLALALSKNNFKSLIIADQKPKTKESNLVTFLSEGSLKYISNVLDTENIFPDSEHIENYTVNIGSRKKKQN